MDIFWWIFGGVVLVSVISSLFGGSVTAVGEDNSNDYAWRNDDTLDAMGSDYDDLGIDSGMYTTSSIMLDDTVNDLDMGSVGNDSFLDNDFAINPASGLPMVGGIGGVDVEGNPYGTDLSDDIFESGSNIDDSFSSFDSHTSFDDSFSSFDDGFSSFDDY